ncbi:MATE family efflux transporter [Kiloniella sp. b19]|uniref:MATE family efflux transporter n=1 Tax=Kiloniella sp. GXU_MW_B19 TaxID=3141326 RepID=UPI0031DF67FE
MSEQTPQEAANRTAQTAGSASDLVPHKKVLSLGIPLIITTLTTPLLGLVDTAIMGHLPDAAYLGAVAIGTVVFNFLFWSFGSLRLSTVGFSAQALGAGDQMEQKASLLRPLISGLCIGVALVLLQWPLLTAGLWLMGGTEQVSGFARDYAEIRIWAAPLTLGNYALVGWFLGRGQTRTTLFLQVLINLVNIALSLLFVIELNMTIKGVAFATVLAEGTGFLAGLVMAFQGLRKIRLRTDWAQVLERARLLALAKVNGDIFIRSACLVLSFGLFTKMGASFGEETLAANAVLIQLVYLASYALDAFAHVAEILTGQAKGARDRSLFDAAVRQSSLWAAGTSLVIALAFWFGGSAIISLFTSIPAVQINAETYLIWAAISPLVGVASYQLDGVFTGTTQTSALRNGMVQSAIVYAVSALVLSHFYGNHGLWLAFSGFFALRALTLLRYYPTLRSSIGAENTHSIKAA